MKLSDIRDADIAGKTVLLRADLNVALRGGAADATRIVRCAETIAALVDRGARVVVIAHLGHPKGIANPVLSIAPIARLLSVELGREVQFVGDCIGAVAERTTRSLADGAVAVLENLRFHAGEEHNDRAFALMLSVNGDIYVNDAPACSVRRHASIDAIVALMPAFAGPQLIAAVANLDGTEALRLPGVAALMSNTKVLETS
ncbi:MAG: phosphoglycerate kinase [Devosia sp.]|nr:phosphoglycerate kinase [Devosia sp.]